MPKRDKIAADETQPSIDTETIDQPDQSLQFLLSWNAELIGFYAHRYQQYGMLPLRLLSCSTLADMQKLQGEFLQQLVVDYRDEAATLSKIVGDPDQQSGTSLGSDYAAGLQKAQRDAAAIIEEGKAQAARIVASAEEQAKRLTDLPEEQEKKRA